MEGLEIAVSLEGICEALNLDSEHTSVRKTGRGRTVKTPAVREWPPPCSIRLCQLKGCVCHERLRKPSDDYNACAALIYGPDNAMNASAKPLHPTRIKRSCEPPVQETQPAIDEVFAQKRRREPCPTALRGLNVKRVKSVRNAYIQPRMLVASAAELMYLFEDDENSPTNDPTPLNRIDLECKEDTRVACWGEKRVSFTGLPTDPPEFKPNSIRSVARSWTPAKYVNAIEGEFSFSAATQTTTVRASKTTGVVLWTS